MSSLLERIAPRSVADGECVVWTGGKVRGYGQTSLNGRKVLVHRAAWVERHGPIPPETPHVLHRCDNPPCWRDDHLWLGTHADNMRDMRAKGRAHVPAPLSHCAHGHELSGDNVVLDAGHGNCRACRTGYHAATASRRKAERAARRGEQ